MSKNGVNRVAQSVSDLTKRIEKAADGAAERMDKIGNETLDKIHKVERSVIDPLEEANKSLDALLVGDNTSGMSDEELEKDELTSPLGSRVGSTLSRPPSKV